jgi:PAS domain S-box-containing protein
VNKQAAPLDIAAEHIGRTAHEMVPALADRVEPLMRQVLETGEPILDLPLTGAVPSSPGEVRRWFDYTGTTLEEMQGWGWTSVHHPDHVERVVTRIRHAWETGEPWEDTFPLRGKHGQYRWFLSRAVPIRAADGRIVRWFGTNTDITELRQAERSQQALADASQAQTVADHQQSAPEYEIMVESALPRLEGWVDVARIRRVLDNLLSNAIKYSPSDAPIIVRVARAEDPTGAWAILEVEDEGVGVPAAEVGHIFERFHRAGNVVGLVRGTGIGLAGARQIVEQHGGRIDLRSQEGQGSIFTVRLPLPPNGAPLGP